MEDVGTARQIDEHLLKTLKAKGVPETTIFQNYNCYFRCPQCSIAFGRKSGQVIPNLLHCGHLCCDKCYCSSHLCFACNPPYTEKKIKQRNMAELYPAEKDESNTIYNFRVVIDDTVTPVKNIKGNVSLSQVVSSNPTFRKKNGPNYELFITLNEKSLSYKRFGPVAIKDIPEAAPKRTNIIILYMKYNGGRPT